MTPETQAPPQGPRDAFLGQLRTVAEASVALERSGKGDPLAAGRVSDLMLRSAAVMVQEFGLKVDGPIGQKLEKLLNAAHRTGVKGEVAERIPAQVQSLRNGDAVSPVALLDTAQYVFHEAPRDQAQYFNHLEAVAIGTELMQELAGQNPDAIPSDHVQEKINEATSVLQADLSAAATEST